MFKFNGYVAYVPSEQLSVVDLNNVNSQLIFILPNLKLHIIAIDGFTKV